MNTLSAVPTAPPQSYYKKSMWGLPGGRVDFCGHKETTVRIALINERRQILLALEREKEIITNRPVQETYQEYLASLKRTLSDLRKYNRSSIVWKDLQSVLDTYVTPEDLKKMDTCWNGQFTKKKLLLTAIKETLEETGYLIRPKILKRIHPGEGESRAYHANVLYSGLIVTGNLLEKETKEIKKLHWFSIHNLPDIQGGSLEKGFGYPMYERHRNEFVPLILEQLRIS